MKVTVYYTEEHCETVEVSDRFKCMVDSNYEGDWVNDLEDELIQEVKENLGDSFNESFFV